MTDEEELKRLLSFLEEEEEEVKALGPEDCEPDRECESCPAKDLCKDSSLEELVELVEDAELKMRKASAQYSRLVATQAEKELGQLSSFGLLPDISDSVEGASLLTIKFFVDTGEDLSVDTLMRIRSTVEAIFKWGYLLGVENGQLEKDNL